MDSSSLACRRLVVLSAHLAAGASSAVSGGGLPLVLERSPVSAQDIERPPANLGGSLTVIDGRTGKKYEIKVSEEGTIRATDFKKVTGFNGFYL